MKIAVAGGTGTVGTHVVAALEASGHSPIVLSRSVGVDLLAGDGIDGALSGVTAVVDASGPSGASDKGSIEFFGSVTRNLLAAEQRVGVRHHVALSIVNAARINKGYYAGKRVQEDLITAASGGWTILRATQFHEFAPMLVRTAHVGSFVTVPKMRTQPIAAAEVGAALAELAIGDPRGILPDLAGPRVENMADMVRRYLRATKGSGRVLELSLPGAWWRALRDGSLLPRGDAQLGTQTYEEWLASL